MAANNAQHNDGRWIPEIAAISSLENSWSLKNRKLLVVYPPSGHYSSRPKQIDETWPVIDVVNLAGAIAFLLAPIAGSNSMSHRATNMFS